MPAASKPDNEQVRLKVLNSYNVLDTLAEEEFDNIVKLASSICQTPIALVSFVDEGRQWFKAKVGLEASETSRDVAFCAHAILDSKEPLIVEDATKDERFADNALVTGQPEIRFYAGQPLIAPTGEALGTLCAIDTKPRKLSEEQKSALTVLGAQTVQLLELKKSKSDLNLERERLKLAEETAQIGHWEVDTRTEHIYWSDQVFDIHGVTPDSFDPNLDSAIDFYHPDDREIVITSLNKVTEKHEDFAFEARLIRRDGEERVVKSSGKPKFDGLGNLVGIFGVFQDVTDRLNTVLELRNQTKHLENAEKFGRLGHWRSDLIKNQLYWSKEVYRITGVSPDSFTPTPETAINFYHPDDIQRVKDILDDAREAIGGFSYEARIIRPDGQTVYIKADGECFADASGELVGIFGTFQDVSDRVNSERKIRDAKTFQDLILENIPDLVFVKDEEFKLVLGNKAFINVYPEDMRDKIIGYTTVEEYPEDEAAAFLAKDVEAFEKGYSDTLEKIQFPDGDKRTLFTKKIRFENQEGQAFILALGTNVTEREQLIERLVSSNEELERFAFVCSHDLQEPLRMIRSFSDKLETHLDSDFSLDEKAKKYLHFVTDGAKRSQDLIADILAYSSIDGETKSQEEIDPGSLIATISKSMQNGIEGFSAEITHQELPIISGNKTQIYQLLQNLINNGIKYQQANAKPKVHINAIDMGKHWKFSVRDNGIGIDPKNHRKVFDVFRRLHGRSQFAGTGIGLSICKKIVERHGGEIWVESQKGDGATFYFTLIKPRNAGVTNDYKDKAGRNTPC